MDFETLLALLVAGDPSPDPDAAKQIDRWWDRAAALSQAATDRANLGAVADPSAVFVAVTKSPETAPATKPGK